MRALDRDDDTIDLAIDMAIDSATKRMGNDPEFHVANPVALATTILKRRCSDLIQGRRNDPYVFRLDREMPSGSDGTQSLSVDDWDTSFDLPSEGRSDVADGALDPFEHRGHPDSDVLLDAARMLVTFADEEPWVRSAALVALAIYDLDEVPAAFGVPRPRAGANRGQRVMWPALWCAGRRSCLSGDGASAALRQQRARSARRVSALVSGATEAVRADPMSQPGALEGEHG
jgi:hypothetical protein